MTDSLRGTNITFCQCTKIQQSALYDVSGNTPRKTLLLRLSFRSSKVNTQVYEIQNPHALQDLLRELSDEVYQHSRNAKVGSLKGAIL